MKNYLYNTILMSLFFAGSLTIADDISDTHNVSHKNLQLDLYLDLIRYNTQEKIGIMPYLLKKPVGTYLEIGTGGDPIAEMFAQIPASSNVTIIASDIENDVLKSLPKRHPHLKHYIDAHEGPQLKLMQLDATDMSAFQDNSLEGINASSVVHEIISYAGGYAGINKFFKEAARTLKHNGILVYRDPEHVDNYKKTVTVTLKTKNIRLFAHIFLYKFIDKRGSSLEKIGRKFCAYTPSDITFTVFKKNSCESSKLTYEEYLQTPSYDIDFSRKYTMTMPCGLYRELARHYLTYLHQCNPLAYVKCTPEICSEMYTLNYLAHSTNSVLDLFFSQNRESFNNEKISFEQKNKLENHMQKIMQVIEFGIPLHFSSKRDLCKLRSLLQEKGFPPHIYMISIDSEDCLLDYRIFGLLYNEINVLLSNEYNWIINSEDEQHAKWLKREGEESYFYMPADELITMVLKNTQSYLIDENGTENIFVLCPLSAETNKFIERKCYSEVLQNSLEVQDDLGFEIKVIDGKRVIHFSKILLTDAINICKNIIQENPTKYKNLKAYIYSVDKNK